jgi:hypothetical protein
MTPQPELFSANVGLGGYREVVAPVQVPETPFQRGIAISTRVGHFKWTGEQQRRVDEAIVAVSRAKGLFTSDDIWEYLGAEFPVTKGLAGRLNAACKRGHIRNTGNVTQSKRGGLHCHGQRLTIWAAYGL